MERSTPSMPSAPPPLNTSNLPTPIRKAPVAVTDLENPNHPLHHHRRNVNDFEYGHALGEGSYSTVISAKDKKTDKQYAIKKLDKAHIVKNDKVKYVMIERDALSRMNHPGIVKLYWTFRDNRSLYYVLDLAPNGELYSLIRKMAPFDAETARFYAAELLLALEHIHSNGVVHRDIKPENILLDEQMHIKITDFGSAKFLPKEGDATTPNAPAPGASGSTRSFVGTAEYVSPELLRSEPTVQEADWWAFGCVIFQMLTGKSPFKAATDYLIFQKIKNLDYDFPEGFDPSAKDLVQKLLLLAPEKRMGSEHQGGSAAIRAHPFFDGMDWQQDIFKKTAPEMALQYRDDLKWQQQIQQEKMDDSDDFETWFNGAGHDASSALPPQQPQQPQQSQQPQPPAPLQTHIHPQDHASLYENDSHTSNSSSAAARYHHPSEPMAHVAAPGANPFQDDAHPLDPDTLSVDAAHRDTVTASTPSLPITVSSTNNPLALTSSISHDRLQSDTDTSLASHHPSIPDHLGAQAHQSWVSHLFPSESIVRASKVSRRRGLFTKKRFLILTDRPRLLYMDEGNAHDGSGGGLRCEIAWTAKMLPELKGKSAFAINTPQKTYTFEVSGAGQAEDWVNTINTMLVDSFGISA
ncbi:kinase-like domain-containing protein [Gongronella butleri]|nr:kinase-like domain-containing protein [Gongronella butleri]